MSRRFQGGENSEILGQNTVKNEDMFQCRHEVGTVNDSDKAVPLSVIQSCPVATCETAGGTAAKVGVVNNFSDFTLLNGREVLVYFASGNTADNPTFNLNNTGAFPLALENQLSTVSIGSGCWEDGVFLHLKYVDITVSNTRIQKWIICGHRIASQSSTQTTYADGQGRTNTVASGNMQSVTSGAVAKSLKSFSTILLNGNFPLQEEYQIDISSYDYIYIDSVPDNLSLYHFTCIIPCDIILEEYTSYWLTGYYQSDISNFFARMAIKKDKIKSEYVQKDGDLLTVLYKTKIFGVKLNKSDE